MKCAALVTLALTACATDGADRLADDEAKQVAMSIASTLRPIAGGGELGALLDAATLVRGDMPADLVREDDRTVRGQRAGFSFRYEVACRDDHNVAQRCDRFSDNADVDASWSGVVSNAHQAYVMVSTREGTWVVNDIAHARGRTRIDGDGHVEARVVAVDDAHAVSYDASYQNIIVFPGERWPRGGLVRYELVIDEAGQRSDLIRAELRFAASGHVTIVLPDHAFDLDLATGIVAGAR